MTNRFGGKERRFNFHPGSLSLQGMVTDLQLPGHLSIWVYKGCAYLPWVFCPPPDIFHNLALQYFKIRHVDCNRKSTVYRTTMDCWPTTKCPLSASYLKEDSLPDTGYVGRELKKFPNTGEPLFAT